MNILVGYVLLILLVVLAISAYTDVRYGIIRNKYLIMGCLLSIPVQIYECFYVNKDFMIWLGSIAIISIVSIIIYCLGYWAAGDCKLLMSIAIMFPTSLYWQLNVWWKRPISLLAVFIAITYGFILLDTLKNIAFNMNALVLTWKKVVTRSLILGAIKKWLGIILLSNIFSIINNRFFKWPSVYIAVAIFLVTVLASTWIKEISRVWYIALGIDVFVFVVCINRIDYIMQNFLIMIILFLVNNIIHIYNYRIIETKKVKRGMIVSSLSAQFLIEEYGLSFLENKKDENMNNRLSKEEANLISKCTIDKIRIVRKIPFASFIFFATVLYFLVGILYANKII